MQNVRSKSTTRLPASRSVGWRESCLAPAAGSMAAAGAAPRLRPVPGRIALFLIVLSIVAMTMVPRLMAFASSSAPQPSVYVVESGETLWGIALRNSSGDPCRYVDHVVRLNALSSPRILPGQRLTLP